MGVLFGISINREAPSFLAKTPNMHIYMVRPKNVEMWPRPVLQYARCGSHTPHTPHDQSISHKLPSPQGGYPGTMAGLGKNPVQGFRT
jgi:hypothetical protein